MIEASSGKPSPDPRALEQSVVCVTHSSFGAHDPEVRADLEAAVGEVRYLGRGRPYRARELAELLPDVDGLLAGLDEINGTVFSAAKKLRAVSRYGVGTDNVDLEAAQRHGVVVTNTPGANADSVAELAVGLTFTLARAIALEDRRVRTGAWVKPWGRQVAGSTVGIIGLGNIGCAYARRMSALGCNVVANDLEPNEDFAHRWGIRLASKEDVVLSADVLSLHVPLTEETLDMVDLAFLGRLPRHALFVNTARGELVVEEDLVGALEAGYLGGAALDTLRLEPPNPGNPLLSLENVVLTSHIGAQTPEASTEVGRRAASDLIAVLSGHRPRFPVVSLTSRGSNLEWTSPGGGAR